MPEPEKKSKGRNVWLIAGGIYAIIALCAYLIVNSSAISSWFGKIISVVFPLLLGLAIAYLCNPILRLFDQHVFKKVRTHTLRRLFSVILTYAIVFAIIAAFLWVLIPELVKSMDELLKQYSEYVKTASSAIVSFIDRYLPGIASDNLKEEEIQKKITEFLLGTEDFLNSIVDFVRNYAGTFISGLKNTFLGLVISVYFLYSKERRCAQCKKFATAVFNDKQQQFLYRTYRRFDTSFGGFFEGKLLDSAIIGILTYIILLIFRIPFPVLVAFVVAVTNIIPIFGPFIGGFASAFIIFIEDPKKVIPFIIIILVIQQLDGNVIGPKILGDNIGVSSFCVMTSIIIMGNLFGVVGMIIGVPLFAVIIEFVSEFLDKRLKAKNKPIDLEKYKQPGLVADADPSEYRETEYDDAGNIIHKNSREHMTFSKRVVLFFREKKQKKKDAKGDSPVKTKTSVTPGDEPTGRADKPAADGSDPKTTDPHSDTDTGSEKGAK